jgi:hypothetical protein
MRTNKKPAPGATGAGSSTAVNGGIVAEIHKNSRDVRRIGRRTFKGYRYLDVRRDVAPCSSSTPQSPAPGFADDRQRGVIDATLAGLVVLAAVCALLLSGWLP